MAARTPASRKFCKPPVPWTRTRTSFSAACTSSRHPCPTSTASSIRSKINGNSMKSLPATAPGNPPSCACSRLSANAISTPESARGSKYPRKVLANLPQQKGIIGMGERYTEQALERMEVGTFGLSPKKMAHFALSKTYTILQVHGIGPFTTQWVVPVYKLTAKGVLLQTSAAESGHPTPTSPPGCFALKLGDRVRGSSGEGVVVEAQCTPAQLTQYRIEKPDGDHFWAQRDELNTP